MSTPESPDLRRLLVASLEDARIFAFEAAKASTSKPRMRQEAGPLSKNSSGHPGRPGPSTLKPVTPHPDIALDRERMTRLRGSLPMRCGGDGNGIVD